MLPEQPKPSLEGSKKEAETSKRPPTPLRRIAEGLGLALSLAAIGGGAFIGSRTTLAQEQGVGGIPINVANLDLGPLDIVVTNVPGSSNIVDGVESSLDIVDRYVSFEGRTPLGDIVRYGATDLPPDHGFQLRPLQIEYK